MNGSTDYVVAQAFMQGSGGLTIQELVGTIFSKFSKLQIYSSSSNTDTY